MMLTPRTWHLLNLLADGQFYSGETLAQCLGVSRATVCNTINQAVQAGIAVQRIRGRGYRLSQPWQILNRLQLIEQLGETAERLDIHLQQSLPSSNADLLQRIPLGAPSGSVLAVELQTAGRGRLGRTWHSGLGNALTFSILWRFDHGLSSLSGLSLAVSVALLRGLHAAGIHGVQLKWPNDLITPHGKLGGILLEARGDMLGPCAVVIGIGINCTLPHDLAQRIEQTATALDQLGSTLPPRNTLFATLLQQLVIALDQFTQHGFAPFRAEWEAHHAQQDQTITLALPDGSLCTGIARGVSDTGELKLSTAQGMRMCHSGEVQT
jgi:BirA family biotin operon repressor/biotin-[acetyl-CoA-carboxylase] ligase